MKQTSATTTSGEEISPTIRFFRQVGAAFVPPDGHFRTVLEALPIAVYSTDPDGRITFFNEAAAVLWGCRPELGEDRWCGSWKLYWPDGTPLPHDECPMAIALKEGRAVSGMEAIAQRRDGTRVPFMPFATPIFDPSGALVGGVNMLLDLTDRKHAEQYAQELAAIVESSDDAIIGKNLDGIITSWNYGAQQVFGYTMEEAVGQPGKILIPPHLHDEEPHILERIKRGERVDRYDTVRQRKDGSLVDISLAVSPVKDARGKIVGASKIAQDVTERRRSEQDAQRLAAIVEISADAIVSRNLDGLITSWNYGAERLLGYTAEDVIGQPATMLIPQDRRDEELRNVERLRRGERIDPYETVRQRKDGSSVEVSLTVSPVRNARGKIFGSATIARDITERRRSQELQNLLHIELTHRIKNTLATVQAIATRTLRSASGKERAEFLARLHALAGAYDLLKLESWNSAPLRDVVERALEPFRETHCDRFLISGPGSIWLTADKSLQLATVLHELATNAVKYGALSNSTGQVHLEWELVQNARPGRVKLSWRESGGPRVRPPKREGLGSLLIGRALDAELGAKRIEFAPEGVVCTLEIAL
jgi:PAS domain S-box-containing protein